jgi:hypothetical protein
LFQAANKQEFPQEDDLVILIGRSGVAPGAPYLLEFPNSKRELRSSSGVPTVAFQNRGPQESGQKLKFIA